MHADVQRGSARVAAGVAAKSALVGAQGPQRCARQEGASEEEEGCVLFVDNAWLGGQHHLPSSAWEESKGVYGAAEDEVCPGSGEGTGQCSGGLEIPKERARRQRWTEK